MRIELKQPYKSIKTLTTDELPDFAVLIGRNGAGKTQLLDALSEGVATILDIGMDDIEKYDMLNFGSPDAGGANRHANQFAHMTADAYLSSPPGSRPPIVTAAAIFNEFAGVIERDSSTQAREDFERKLKDDIQQLGDFAVFAANSPPSSYERELYGEVLAPLIPKNPGRRSRSQTDQPKNRFNGNQAALLSSALKLTDKLPHELTRDDIVRASYYEGDTLANSVSAVFVAYKVDQYTWAHKRIETECVSYTELITEYRAKYPPPWDTLREILSEMRDASGDDGLFNFDFSDPDAYVLDMSNYERFSFKAEMTNRTTGAQYELNALSSGERVLMALCLASFNKYLGRRLPKLLLLDELDAVLHPSMVEALIRTLKTLFVQQNTKVLMTSHSPMTMVALDEADIFRVVRTRNDVKVFRATKSEAIGELSEGLATVDVGLRIAAYDEAKVTILSEGNNARHLKKWVELYFSNDVQVFEDLEQHRCDSQLLAYGRLLGRMNTDTHFVIVWDCDAADKARTLHAELPCTAKVTPFAFAKRKENAIASRGIENVYDEKILEPFSIEKVDFGGKSLGREFPQNRKTKFADHVLQEGTAEYFTHFQDLHSIISGLLESFD